MRVGITVELGKRIECRQLTPPPFGRDGRQSESVRGGRNRIGCTRKRKEWRRKTRSRLNACDISGSTREMSGGKLHDRSP